MLRLIFTLSIRYIFIIIIGGCICTGRIGSESCQTICEHVEADHVEIDYHARMATRIFTNYITY